MPELKFSDWDSNRGNRESLTVLQKPRTTRPFSLSFRRAFTTTHWSAGGELREKKENQKRKILKIHVAFDYCSIQSTVHENCYNSQSGKKWQPKIGQNMPKTSSNPNFCLKMRHDEAQLRTIRTNLAHFRTKFKLIFTYKKHFTNQTLGDGF